MRRFHELEDPVVAGPSYLAARRIAAVLTKAFHIPRTTETYLVRQSSRTTLGMTKRRSRNRGG